MMPFPICSSPFSTSNFIILLYFLSFLLPAASKLQGNATDRDSLLEFKKMIKGDPFGVMSSWNETIHFCEWPGVSCGRRHRRVTALGLSSMKLVGSLPSHIGNLSFLRVLDLQNNSFSGDIPPAIGNLHRLQVLLLHNNSFTGFIPSNISGCINLEALNFSNNYLMGSIPSQLGTLTNLQTIHFVHNNLTGKIPPSLGNLSLLYEFFANKNNLVGEVPDSLCRISGLQYLIVYENNLSGTLPSSLFNHSSMLAIDVGNNFIEGSLPPNLFITLPRLLYFSIHNDTFTGNIPPTLSNATNLQFFYISRNGLTGKVPDLGNLHKLQRFLIAFNHLGEGEDGDLNFLSSLTNATNLELLELNTNNFGGVLPESISNLSRNLIEIGLSYNKVSGKIPRGISNLIGLEALYLAYNKFNEEIPPELGFLSGLQELALLGNHLSGKIPSSFGNLTLLTRLSLRENHLQGIIPSSLGKCLNLALLDLGQNNLSGYIPQEVLQQSSLCLDFSQNQLTGSIPEDVGNLKFLNYLDLSYNSLSGHIPKTLGSCVQLEMLNLTNNNLQGNIPSTMQNLKSLQFLELSNNGLTGEIPSFFKNFKYLQNLNLSYNDFEGPVPSVGVFNDTSSFSIIGNRNLCGGISQLGLHECETTKPKKSKSSTYLKIVIPVISGFLVLTLVVCFLSIRWLKRSRKEPPPDSQENSILRMSYQTLLKATNGFASANLLGIGGFGAVYKGTFDHDGTVFAVKVLNLLHSGATRSFMAECEVLKNTRHRNLVKVLTACSGVDFQGNDFKALVYEYMKNGSLEDWLHFSPQENSQSEEHKKLSFVQRLNIATDVACALDYLHNDCELAIIHRDLKPSNVLLDNNMTGHVSDFGLARFVQPSILCSSASQTSTAGVRGTIGYMAPEYGMGSEVSKSADVYSFGILILEIFTGRRPTDELFKDGLNIHNYAKAALPVRGMEIADPILIQERDEQAQIKQNHKSHNRNDEFQECLVSLLEIGVTCSEESPRDRMNIGEVVGKLNILKKSL
ncbi:probable LRR receptor-like serine/threonine-protein kinase At3g47570 [Ipomoea triloba]|uniref:probable LRR receptor-like serine/threonine-protein kinase At3g47570 n=1 Tax=Ipomoea triloba TaxID=35885 RepID=UPI00125D2398|nr:probable LRR receptor-like serine/threonine-protein kinase At3g47570 [Ipomoea triloba]